MTQHTETVVDHTMDNLWLTDRFHLNAWEEIVYVNPSEYRGFKTHVLRHNYHFTPLKSLLQSAARGELVEQPDGYNLLVDFAHALFINSTSDAQLSQRNQEMVEYKSKVRDALFNAWGGHKSHITKDALNDFLLSIDLEPSDTEICSAYVEVTLRLALGGSALSHDEDLDDHLMQEAQAELGHRYEIDSIEVIEVEYED